MGRGTERSPPRPLRPFTVSAELAAAAGGVRRWEEERRVICVCVCALCVVRCVLCVVREGKRGILFCTAVTYVTNPSTSLPLSLPLFFLLSSSQASRRPPTLSSPAVTASRVSTC